MSTQIEMSDGTMHPEDCAYCHRAWQRQEDERSYRVTVNKRLRLEMQHYRNQMVGLHTYLVKQFTSVPRWGYGYGLNERARKLGTIGLKYLALKERLYDED
jgi:hypothetical protein